MKRCISDLFQINYESGSGRRTQVGRYYRSLSVLWDMGYEESLHCRIKSKVSTSLHQIEEVQRSRLEFSRILLLDFRSPVVVQCVLWPVEGSQGSSEQEGAPSFLA